MAEKAGPDKANSYVEPAVAGRPETTAGDPTYADVNFQGQEVRPPQATFGAGKEQMVHEAAHAQTSTVSSKAGMTAADTRQPRDGVHPIKVAATTVADEYADGWNDYNRPKGNTPERAGKGKTLMSSRGAMDGAVARQEGA